jgi:1,4-alpha-glucan branching enzyme
VAAGPSTIPYSFAGVLGATDDYLLVEGTHRQLYEKLGAHLLHHEGVDGVHFAVWAPDALRVSVVGNFNGWDGRRHQMRKRVDSGLWELFAPGFGEGEIYKYEIVAADGIVQPLKADPVGFAGELRPSTASVVARTDNFEWNDDAFLRQRGEGQARRQPMSIYEVHLGSWQRGEGNSFLSYDELADRLIPYAVELGFTHLELLPVSEHPLDDSWGYQPIGLFAPTRRHGEPAGFARFVDRAHQAGLGIILDWVPAHFPTDRHGLAHFDGKPLYEHADPRRGFHPDWNTAIYDFGAPKCRTSSPPARCIGSIASMSTACASMPSPRCSISITREKMASGCPTRTAPTTTRMPSPSSPASTSFAMASIPAR